MTSPATKLQQEVVVAHRVAFGIGGLIAIALGCFVLFAPGTSARGAAGFIAFLIAAYAVIVGIVYLATAIWSGKKEGWGRIGHILLGVVYVIAGIVMVSNLLASGTLMIIFIVITIGIVWLFEGFMALVTVKQSKNKVWTIIFAVVSIIAGVTLMFSPLMGAAALWMLLGISLLVLGIMQVVRAITLKPLA